MQLTDTVFLIAVIIFSAVIHEVMHGLAADSLGDKTARYAGRLTLNPIPHLDLFGSILLPLILALSGATFFFAWAKPVPYNPYNLRPGRFSEAIVAGAGPASNLILALLTGFLMRVLPLTPELASIFFIIVIVNIMLCIFNLIPVPPLDGSKVLEPLLPRSLAGGYARWRAKMEVNPFAGMAIVIIFLLVFGGQFASSIYTIARLIAGI